METQERKKSGSLATLASIFSDVISDVDDAFERLLRLARLLNVVRIDVRESFVQREDHAVRGAVDFAIELAFDPARAKA